MDPAVRDVVEFAATAALDPRAIEDADVERVRDHGYDDAALVELVVTALIAFTLSAVNQVFDLRECEGQRWSARETLTPCVDPPPARPSRLLSAQG